MHIDNFPQDQQKNTGIGLAKPPVVGKIAKWPLIDEAGQCPIPECDPFPSKGLRFNNGKLRYDLEHPIAREGMIRVLTKGADKYAPRNWEKGISWTATIACLKRHLAAIEKGEDYDPETGELHIDHVQCNAHFLSAYYKIAPQFDDRPRKPDLKIGLDIDDVICSWVTEWCRKFNLPVPTTWNFDWNLTEQFEELRSQKGFDPSYTKLDEFYLNLPAKIAAADLPFVPACYITHRPVDIGITERWLKEHGFPLKPVFQVLNRESKLTIAQEEGLDVFVDDNYDTFKLMNNNGVVCYLMDALHNQRHDVGYKRIYSLRELKS